MTEREHETRAPGGGFGPENSAGVPKTGAEAATELPTSASEPAVERAADAPVTDFADYRILEKIGEGGMGEVYRAEQVGPIRRHVALKVIKPGMDSREVIARFESERQALALMNHPGIARVFEAGTTPQGRPFFAMEYIRGIPITEYVDLHQLNTRERLKLFAKVCDAVQHAHQKAILHRDLKPSNVLVTVIAEEPQPKVIDFGVAKALSQRLTDKTLFTELGRFVGTPEYMSPEQALGSGEQLDTRSDIYSLGVILYEILVGARPFDRRSFKGGIDELRRRIREDDPPRPSTRITQVATETGRTEATPPHPTSRRLRGDLDWITLKALEKEPGRRYPTAHDLALDIERHLADEAVLASPPSTTYRLRKFVRRHRASVLLGAVAALAIVAGLVATTFGLMSTRRERDQTERARAEAEQVTKFLAEMLESADPIRSGRQTTVTEMLDRASEKLGGTLLEQPLVEARLRTTIGNTYQALGLYERAERELTLVLDIRRDELGIEHPDTLAAQQSYANLMLDEGRYDAAERGFESLLEARRRLLGETHEDTLWAKYNLATVYQEQERFELAEKLHDEVLKLRIAALGEDHIDTLTSFENLANLYYSRAEYDRAGELYRNVFEGRTRQLGRKHPLTLDALNNLAAIDHIEQRFDRAEARYREVVESGREVRGAEHPQTLVALGNLGELYGDLGRYEEAEELLSETLRIKERVLGVDHPSTEYTRTELARLRRETYDDGPATATSGG